ncbi:TPA: hypothetical protein HA241_01000 [Candidatus Woesearchaeota archaeon]|nr:hypothetical protein [Candidatus Woesearchaeota archaeon]
MREQDKHFLWSLYAAVAVIFLWKGIWEGIYEIPYIGQSFVFLFLGLFILTISGLIFKEFDPLGGVEKAVSKVVHQVYNHPQKGQFQFKYYDKSQRKDIIIEAHRVHAVERGTLVMKHHTKNSEVFIPTHRITEVLQNGKVYWRL